MGYFTSREVAVVTGGASGIGRECALLFAREGARVVVSDISEKGGIETVRSIAETGGEAAFKAADVADPASVEALVSFAQSTFGGLHALVNNAGIGGASAPIADYPLDSWDQVIAINQSGVFYGMKYGIPAILSSGGGAVVNMTSILGAVGIAGSVAYVAAKHAILGMTQTAALEYSAAGVRVNAVGPGFIDTPLIAGIKQSPQTYQALVHAHPIGRLGKPEEVAELTVWLCSSRASFCTGSYYPVEGGYLAQ